MPISKGKSGLAAKYGAKLDAAVQAHANDPTEFGTPRIVAGIEDGVAQLTKCGFGVFKTGQNKGEYYFRAEGTVIQPTSIIKDGREVVTEGMQTSVMEPVCDTKTRDGKVTTCDEHVKEILNHLRMLGVDTTGATLDQLEELAGQAQDMAPYFRFATSLRKARNPKETDGVWENWYGVRGLENFQPGEGNEANDATGAEDQAQAPAAASPPARTPARPAPAPSGNGHKAPATAPGKPAAAPVGGGKAPARPTPKPAPEPEPEPEAFDVDGHLAVATDDDHPEQATSQTALKDAAKELGYTDEQLDADDTTWEMIAEWVRGAPEAGGGEAGTGGTGEEENQEPEELVPEKGTVYYYHPTDPKTKKPVKKPVEVKATLVKAKTKTVDLQSLENPKTVFKDVPWADVTTTD